MPKIDLNHLVATLSGTVGNLVVYQLNGKTVARRKPNRKAPRTAAEKAQNDRMKRAAAYGKSIKTDPEKRAFYAALPQVPGLGLFHLAVRDFHHSPVVHEIDLSGYSGKTGEKIQITATDDSKVTEVTVEIRSMDEALLETGAAQLDEATGLWQYAATKDLTAGQSVAIQVVAKDQPGNTTSKTALGYTR